MEDFLRSHTLVAVILLAWQYTTSSAYAVSVAATHRNQIRQKRSGTADLLIAHLGGERNYEKPSFADPTFAKPINSGTGFWFSKAKRSGTGDLILTHHERKIIQRELLQALMTELAVSEQQQDAYKKKEHSAQSSTQDYKRFWSTEKLRTRRRAGRTSLIRQTDPSLLTLHETRTGQHHHSRNYINANNNNAQTIRTYDDNGTVGSKR